MWMEHGPVNVAFNLTSRPVFNLTKNPYSWNANASVVYLDFPLGNGFSFSPGLMAYRYLDSQMQVDLYTFLEYFMLVYPKFKGRPLFIAGEGLAGHLIPIVSKYIVKMENPDINLKGVAIGNGWVDPFYQFSSHNDYAIENGIINPGRGFVLNMAYKLCEFTMLIEIPILSQLSCYFAELAIIGNPVYPSFNPFDFKKQCEHPFTCYDNYDLALFINNGPFRRLSGGMTQWDECDQITRTIMMFYAQFNYGHYLTEVLESDVAVLVYNGDLDYMNNWKGAQAWTEAIPWEYQDAFNEETWVDWRVNTTADEPQGEYKNFELLTLFRIYDAGKMVPRDQPAVAQNMILEFITNGRLVQK